MKMKTKTKITSIFMLALLATACSNGDDPVNGGQAGEDKSEILLRTTVMTRTSVESNSSGIITTPTSLNVAFLRAPDHSSSTATSTVWADAIATVQTVEGTGPGVVDATLKNVSDENVLEFTNSQYYNIDGTIYSHLKGFYPKVNLVKDTHVSATWMIDGKTDVMVTNYFHDNKEVSGSSNPVTFQHLLSKITIKVIADSDAAARSWGDVTEVIIPGTKSTVTHTFDGNEANQYQSTSTASTKEIPVLNASGDQVLDTQADNLTLTTDTLTFGKAMVYPEANYNLVVKTSGGDDAELNGIVISDGGAKPGMDHEITLTFKSGEILPSIKVKPWEDGGTGSGTIQ